MVEIMTIKLCRDKVINCLDDLIREATDVPVSLYDHIRANYDNNIALFARETGRHVNSVTHQLYRDAIWYKGEIYCKVGKNNE